MYTNKLKQEMEKVVNSKSPGFVQRVMDICATEQKREERRLDRERDKRMALQEYVISVLQSMTDEQIENMRNQNAAETKDLVAMLFFDVCAALVLKSRE